VIEVQPTSPPPPPLTPPLPPPVAHHDTAADAGWYARGGGAEKKRSPVPWIIGAVAIVAICIVAAIAVAGHSSTPTSQANDQSTTQPTTASTTTTQPANPVGDAQGIALQAKDLNGFAFTENTGGHVVDPQSQSTECAPLTAQPEANVVSPLYTSNANSALSFVEILPTAADAQSGLSAATAPNVGSACVQPLGNTFASAIISQANQGGPCAYSLTGSSVTPLTAASAWPGATGFRYIASLGCGGHQAGVTADFVDEAEGNVVIQGRFILFGGPQPGLEQAVMADMAARARAYAADQ
jgi:hypothetical protein